MPLANFVVGRLVKYSLVGHLTFCSMLFLFLSIYSSFVLLVEDMYQELVGVGLSPMLDKVEVSV